MVVSGQLQSSVGLFLREERPVPIELETVWAPESLDVMEKSVDPADVRARYSDHSTGCTSKC